MSNGNRMVSKKTPTPVAAAGAPKTTTNAASNATTTAAGAEGAKPRPGGALMLKTVSLFLASSRRFSAQARAAQGANQATARRRAGRKMDAEASGKLTPKQLETLKKRTHFTQLELEALALIFRKLVVSSNSTAMALAANSSNAMIPKAHTSVDGIDSVCFCELLHTTFDIVIEEFLMDRIFIAWQPNHERQPLRLEPFICGLSVFLRGTAAERQQFAFRVYDLNGDGAITKDEMFALLRNCLIHPPNEEDPDEAVREWLDILVRKMDADGDGRISFDDYSKSVSADPLLLEAFGQCFPTRYSSISFLSTL